MECVVRMKADKHIYRSLRTHVCLPLFHQYWTCLVFPTFLWVSLYQSLTDCQSQNHFLSHCFLIGCCCWKNWNLSPSQTQMQSEIQNQIRHLNYCIKRKKENLIHSISCSFMDKCDKVSALNLNKLQLLSTLLQANYEELNEVN